MQSIGLSESKPCAVCPGVQLSAVPAEWFKSANALLSCPKTAAADIAGYVKLLDPAISPEYWQIWTCGCCAAWRLRSIGSRLVLLPDRGAGSHQNIVFQSRNLLIMQAGCNCCGQQVSRSASHSSTTGCCWLLNCTVGGDLPLCCCVHSKKN